MLNIYGTLGPGCADAGALEKMFENGMTGVRLNLAHSTLHDSEEWLSELQTAAKYLGIKPELLIDMQGPEIRVGDLACPLILPEGGEVLLFVPDKAEITDKGSDIQTHADAGTEAYAKADAETGIYGGSERPVQEPVRIPVPEIIMPYLTEGQQMLLDDGKLLLQITGYETTADGGRQIKAKVLRGGRLLSRKSIALPETDLYPPTMTANDRMHISLAKEYGVTGVMQPFVRNRQDLETVREALDEAGGSDIRLFAKIENMDGVRHLSELMPAADEVIIARGDLGNSMPLWQLPTVQKQIAAQCRRAGKPFMVVTQMLASMENMAVPTRAEVSDVFNAVLDGASSLMVTGETAMGKYPVEVIKYLVNTVQSALDYLADNG